jgi:serine protease Do
MTFRTSLFSTACLAACLAAAVAFAPFHAAPARAQDVAQTAPGGFENLAERLLPSVVNISTTTKLDMTSEQRALPQMPDLPPGSPFEDFFRDFYDQFNNQMQRQQQDNGGGDAPDSGDNGDNADNGDGGDANPSVSALGSGFIIDAKNGYIVTNNHVIKDADEIRVILHDDTSLDATLVGVDEKTDLAVLKVKPVAQLQDVKWGDSDQAKVGSWVLAIGNPFGLGGTVTAGIVSARQRNINAGPYDDFIQTDASINRGNSGGPMFNMKGEVVGVNTAIFSPSGGSVGIGFAVPANLAQNVVGQLIKYGETRRGWLGVRIQEVTPEIADSLGLKSQHGALVSSMMDESPAKKAGIEPGDIIMSFNGHEITGMQKLPRMVADTEVGKEVPVTVWRKGKTLDFTVTLGRLEKAEKTEDAANAKKERTPNAPVQGTLKIKQVGLQVAPIDGVTRKRYSLGADNQGVVVTGVDLRSSAAERGILAGDVIVEVNQQAVSAPEDVEKQVAQAEKDGKGSVLFLVSRKDNRSFVALKLKK